MMKIFKQIELPEAFKLQVKKNQPVKKFKKVDSSEFMKLSTKAPTLAERFREMLNRAKANKKGEE